MKVQDHVIIASSTVADFLSRQEKRGLSPETLKSYAAALERLREFVGEGGEIGPGTLALLGATVAGWASTTCIVCFVSGVKLICLGVIGEYIGKIYMETKARPRYIISDRTWE